MTRTASPPKYPTKIGSIIDANICKNPASCAICSGRFWKLSPIEQKRALAEVSHDPTKWSPKKYKPLTPKQIAAAKAKYQRKSKPLKPKTAHWDVWMTKEDFQEIDRKVEAAYQQLHPKGMLIDVNGQDDTKVEKEKQNDAASILMSLKES